MTVKSKSAKSAYFRERATEWLTAYQSGGKELSETDRADLLMLLTRFAKEIEREARHRAAMVANRAASEISTTIPK